MLTTNFVSCVHVMFSLLSFSPYWPPAFLIFSPPLWNFHVFSSNEIRRLGVHSLALALSLFSVSLWVYTSKITSKKHDFFFFSKSPGHSKLNLELHLGYHTCWLSYFFVGVPVVRTDGWSGGRTVTWLPKFLGCIGYQIFSPMVLRARESSAINVEIHGSERKLDDVSSTCGPTSHVVVKQYSKQNTLVRY